jgi:hypothetical protein
METNSKKVLQALPDFNDVLALISKVKELTVKKMKLDSDIKYQEAANFSLIMNSSEFFVGGKPVAVAYYEHCYKFAGIKDNLKSLRQELILITAELDELKVKYDLYKQMQDMYKTMVFAEKSVM